MDDADRRDEEHRACGRGLARLGEASLRINESLEFEAGLQAPAGPFRVGVVGQPMR